MKWERMLKLWPMGNMDCAFEILGTTVARNNFMGHTKLRIKNIDIDVIRNGIKILQLPAAVFGRLVLFGNHTLHGT